MLRTILIFSLVGPVAAGVPFVLLHPFAILLAWVIGGLPMGAAGLVFHLLQTRIWRSHLTRKDYKVWCALPKIVLAAGCAGLSVYITCTLVEFVLPQYEATLRNLYTSGFKSTAAVLGMILQIYLNKSFAVGVALFGGTISGLVQQMLESRQLKNNVPGEIVG